MNQTLKALLISSFILVPCVTAMNNVSSNNSLVDLEDIIHESSKQIVMHEMGLNEPSRATKSIAERALAQCGMDNKKVIILEDLRSIHLQRGTHL